ncbi:MAG: polymerase delta subunit [Actinomycetota bacterium]|jgi:DNA polymerase-3 subunit delta
MGVHLLTGDDESVLRGAVIELVDALVGDGDRTMMVDEFDGPDYLLQSVVDAAQTPPFLTDRRVVLARGIGRFVAADVGSLVAYLADPLDTTELVLVGGGGAVPKSVVDAVKSAGGTVRSTAVATRGRDRLVWVRSRAEARGLTLDDRAVARLVDWLGEGSGALDGVLDTIAAVHTGRARVTVDEIEPLLGDAGGVPPWDLTDAIDAGDTARALTLLNRMVNGGGRHPLQVMAILHQHVARMARLDGSGATDQDSAAAALGIKSSFPAKKALDGARRLGTDDLRRAIGLLATADSDLRGGTGLDELAVMEVLVARLARLGPHARSGGSRRR